ncbi:MAG TPA: Crp/Fnr family transcriptional regulator [Kofleriaceae bacterium]|jgi:CRP-like cAMP-binding protein|nr:Crp/Fnr family transcriptional regulator [Kofleriaceae bacterium]
MVLRDADRDALHRAWPLADDDFAALEPHVRVRELARGALFLAAGDRATLAGVVLAGVLREYYPLADGREVTRNFAGPGDGVGSLSDLLHAEPARTSIVADTEARVIALPWASLRAAADRSRTVERFLAATTERLYLAKATREYELLALDADARYSRFRERFARLESTIALRHVASYVGVTPEHLSRLRRLRKP